MKGLVRAAAAIAISAALTAAVPDTLFADRTAPSDETAAGDRISQVEDEIRRLRDELAARDRRDAEAKRRAEAQRKRAAEQRAKAERERKAREAKLAEERRFSAELERGANFILDGRYRDGLVVMRQFAKAHPYSPDAWYWIALAHNALGDYDRAQYAANIALEIDPYYPALTKTPSGLEPMPKRDKHTRKEPRPSMSVLPVKPVLPTNLALTPITVSFPVLRKGEKEDGERHYGDDRDPVTGSYLEYLPYPPNEPGRTVRWMQDEKFMEISRWRFRVDRMGILEDPQTPIAWRSSYPYEVYFWTGSEWARARRQRVYYDHRESFDDTLARSKEGIREIMDQRDYRWNPGDTPALAAMASHMKFMWMGPISTEPAYERLEELDRRHFIYDSWEQIELPNDGDDRVEQEAERESPSSPTVERDYY